MRALTLLALSILPLDAATANKCPLTKPTTCEEVQAVVKCLGKRVARAIAKAKGATKEELAQAEACLNEGVGIRRP